MRETLYLRWGKRSADVALAAAGLALAAVPLAFLMLLIRLGSRGPALLRQPRVGRRGLAFGMWKLRTMRADAEAGGARFAVPGDARATALGRWLRAARIDELPQLANVLRGEMSLVGPRPERPVHVERFRRGIPGYARRHAVRPGLTGWAQVRLGYAASLEATRAKTRLDLEYLERLPSEGARLDALILLRTLPAVARGIAEQLGPGFAARLAPRTPASTSEARP